MTVSSDGEEALTTGMLYRKRPKAHKLLTDDSIIHVGTYESYVLRSLRHHEVKNKRIPNTRCRYSSNKHMQSQKTKKNKCIIAIRHPFVEAKNSFL